MERKLTESEREYLEDLLSRLSTGRRRTKEAVENFFVMLAVITLVGVLIWAGIAWAVKKLANIEIGWSSEYAIPVVLSVLTASALYAVYSTSRWMKTWTDYRQPLRDDLDGGIVTEEKLTVVEAKLLQEPEHGGLIYFLRTDDERVLVLYDRESLDLAMADEDPMGSSFKPQRAVTIVKAPRSQFTISTSFGGENIDIHGPVEMTASPNSWPEDEDFCSIPWSQIEEQLCASRAGDA